MADDALEGMNIAILVTDGFEQVELIGRARLSTRPGLARTWSPPRPVVCAAGTSRIGGTSCRST